MATVTRPRRAGDAQIRTTAELHDAVLAWHRRLGADADTLAMMAAELRGRLRRAKGIERLPAAIKARRVARHLARASALAEAARQEVARTWTAYLGEYAEQVQPKGHTSGRAGWSFK